MEKTFEIIRKNIKRERRKYGYTQEDMAKILKMSLSAYRKIEQGQRKLSLEHIISISNFLNIDLPTLFRMQTNEMDILNQSEKQRKEFLIELLKTFGIGSPPQKPYNEKDISSLLSFVKAYGRSVPYCPDGIKNRIVFTGKYSDTFREVDRLGNIYHNQLPEKLQTIKDLEKKESELHKQCTKLENVILELQKVEATKLYPSVEEMKKNLLYAKQRLSELTADIRKKEEHLSKLREENFELEGDNIWLKETIKRLEQDAHLLAQNICKSSSGAEKIVEYEKKSILLEGKMDFLQEKYDKLYDNYDALSNDFADKVVNQVNKEKETIMEEYENIVQDKIERITDDYHNLDAETLDDIFYNLILFAQGFETLASKYKTASKNIHEYVKDPNYLMMNIDYSKLCSSEYVSQYAKDNIEWEKKYRANTVNETE